MTSADFRARLDGVDMTLRAFAAYVGTTERTVGRWARGEQDIPTWVGVMLDLMEQQGSGVE